MRRISGIVIVLSMLVASVGGPSAKELSDEALVEALRNGGYNIYFRHAPTDWSQSDRVEAAGDWASCDGAAMRQLSEQGRGVAREVGGAIRALRIPVGEVLSSEYCRAVDTARLLDLGPVVVTRDIMNMRAAEYVGGRDAVVRRARGILSASPAAGTNVVVVGHGNLMRAATGAYTGEAGSGIYSPSPSGSAAFELVAELSADEWLELARRLAARD